ncbi:MAG: DUF1772 domain-containing protein [Gammaproteobacteria bacterium]|nr:DUF1772 domain-containing protein [Gammaproteobacteria bacterium]
MSSTIVTVLVWAAALSSGIMAGIYFAFSVFIIQVFGKIDTAHSIAVMNAINKTNLRSAFMPLFFGSSIVAALLIIVAFARSGEIGAGLILMAGTIYFVGMFVCTIVFNVPRNNTLATVDPSSMNAQDTWTDYLNTWTK